MKVLQGILSESKEYYLRVKKKIQRKLDRLAKGSIKTRKISGKKYFYLQQRLGNRVVHKYLGKRKPDEIANQIQERKALSGELKKVNEALKIIRRSESRRHG